MKWSALSAVILCLASSVTAEEARVYSNRDLERYMEGKSGDTVREAYPANPASSTGRAEMRPACESGHWIRSVSGDGGVITIEDGSLWEVDPLDALDAALWLPLSGVVVCDDRIINVDDDETVSAVRIR